MLRADVVVSQLEGFAKRDLQYLLRARRERDMPARSLRALTDHLPDLPTEVRQRHVQRREDHAGNPCSLVNQAEDEVLRADVVVIEQPCLFLRQNDRAACAVGESVETDALTAA